MAMNINSDYQRLSSYRISDIPALYLDDTAKAKNAEAEKPEEKQQAAVLIEPVADNRPRSLDPNNVSLSFNKRDDFSYLGKEKDISLLDMKQAIADMKADTILHDYQYFVGSSRNVFDSEDGSVIAKF